VSRTEFDNLFTAATTYRSFDYQWRLAEGAGRGITDSQLITVPTGLGKTAAVVLAWLWNRVQQRPCPCRLVYCLPMRTLVEQTRREIETWLSALSAKGDEVGLSPDSKEELRWLVEHSPVVLMGGETNEQRKSDWDIWPEKSCILIGTQDMLLSRALNRGYGMSCHRWPMHFGLLNSDCLWVMDEVQLMGPGLWTSGQLDWMRQKRFETTLPCWTWWMSATNSGGFLDTPDRGDFRPSLFPFDDNEMPLRLKEALRPCAFWTVPVTPPTKKSRSGKTVPTVIKVDDEFASSLSLDIVGNHRPGTLSLVVCNTVNTAQRVHRQLSILDSNGAEIILLTSRFRKGDRQSREKTLIEFEKARKAATDADGAGLICVATQVVEAGVDVSACRLWTEVAPWPSLIQRLGRLNRDGRVNDQARAFFFEVPVKEKKGARQTRIGPYSAEAVVNGKWLATKLVDIFRENPSITASGALARMWKDEKIAKRIAAALQPAPEPFPRALDIHGLFSTEPDIFGGFTDVSPFIRGEDPNSDVIVFWREFDPTRPLRTDELIGPVFDLAEGCPVPVRRVGEFIGNGYGFVWDDNDDLWKTRRSWDLRPGMVVMLPRKAGGYDSSQGWTGASEQKLGEAPQPGPFEEEFRADPFSENGHWVTLAVHLADVRAESERIVTTLQLPEVLRHAVIVSSERHDIGKALDKWQDALPQPAPTAGEKWAKAPFLFAVKPDGAGFDASPVEALLATAGVHFRKVAPVNDSRLGKCCLWHTADKVRDTKNRSLLSEIRGTRGIGSAWMVPFRPALRHEAGSALALWHQYFREGASFPGLSIYLTAAHHGKVRTVLTARTRKGDDVFGVPKCSATIPWDGGLPMDFSCAADGADGEFSDDGTVFTCSSPGWTALVVDLLGDWSQRPAVPTLFAVRDASEPVHLGPFNLALLETLIRCADIQASRNPSHYLDV
jgi:CRISPR-associated endonuclease/helicase Cas3